MWETTDIYETANELLGLAFSTRATSVHLLAGHARAKENIPVDEERLGKV